MPKNSDDTSAITSRLDAILRLFLEYQREGNGTTIGDQILLLMDTGLPQGEAARIAGPDPNQVTSYFRHISNSALYEKLKKKTKGSKTK